MNDSKQLHYIQVNLLKSKASKFITEARQANLLNCVWPRAQMGFLANLRSEAGGGGSRGNIPFRL